MLPSGIFSQSARLLRESSEPRRESEEHFQNSRNIDGPNPVLRENPRFGLGASRYRTESEHSDHGLFRCAVRYGDSCVWCSANVILLREIDKMFPIVTRYPDSERILRENAKIFTNVAWIGGLRRWCSAVYPFKPMVRCGIAPFGNIWKETG